MKRFRWLLVVAALVAVPFIGVASEGSGVDQGSVGEVICAHASDDLLTGGLFAIGSPILGAYCDDPETGVGTLGVEYPDGRWRIR